MKYHICTVVFTAVIMTAFTTFINALGQSPNSTLQEEAQIFNKTQHEQQQFEQQDQVLDKKIINISSTEFNQLLDEIKGSINLMQEKKYDAAASKLGLAIIEILNSTQQYQELVQFAFFSIC